MNGGDVEAAGCHDDERKALLEFKHGVMDLSGRLSSWVGQDCCKWKGVSCHNRTGRVVHLELRNPCPNCEWYCKGHELHILGGDKISPLIVLKDLNYLDLSWNAFFETEIPAFLGSLRKLRYLNLSNSGLDGPIPHNFGNLSRLTYLDLSTLQDALQDPLVIMGDRHDVEWLSRLSFLKYINLGGLGFPYRAVTQTLNNLPSLEELHLPECGLSSADLNLSFVNFTSLRVLDLSGNNLNSTLPHWVFNLKNLVHLDLSGSNLSGQFPDGIVDSLEHLDFSDNGIGGRLSSNLGKLCNLRTLKLSHNAISGEITDFVNKLSACSNYSLETLDLRFNAFMGNLPETLGYIKSLKVLQLQNNSFQGKIPESIGNLSSLEQVSLRNNRISFIPKSLGQLCKLVVLDISNNPWEGVITEAHLVNLSSLEEFSIGNESHNISMVFSISSNWIPSFNLRQLDIQSCQLGPKFPTWLQNQNQLNILELKNASISDTIPDWFFQLDLQLDTLDLAHNNISGRLPNKLRFFADSTINLGSNQFDGPLTLFSSNISSLLLNNNMLSGSIPSDIGKAMPMLTHLDFSWNSLNGGIPLSIGNLTQLEFFIISDNHLSGQVPDVWKDVMGLRALDVSNNMLSGTIPKSISFHLMLNLLLLSNNNFSGELPSSLQYCSFLVSLDLGDNKFSGKLPPWIGENMGHLMNLRLTANFFSGNIPPEFCGLSMLHILDISRNNLSGHIPHCLGNLNEMKSGRIDVEEFLASLTNGSLKIVTKGREMEYSYSKLYLVDSIDLSDNNLSGEIPAELTSLIGLQTLNLSANRLTGKIPSSIGNLTLLETLDLSRNKLFGPIPVSMTSLTFLNHLNLSYNNLTGKIPTANQFLTFDDPSIYQGNVGLCGKPLDNDCLGSSQFGTPRGEKEEKDGDLGDKTEKVGFYISIALGFIVGFWGVFGSLIINKSWRYTYFGFVQRVSDTCFVLFHRMFRGRNVAE
ncbi:receptor-like protein EIX2 [Ziziphus jujuba]|uniref:Receptor-like protein EIX2 n=1 Tax=Ziziphus jujuba TaxID=326968 RepID=A0A6P3YUU3_ZIZJJ|nr:receptor-like protein EIX2 [Ziziphus jujuba]